MTAPVTEHGVVIHTDGGCTPNRGTTKWVHAWTSNGWKTSAKQPVKNVDLWQPFQAACDRHLVEFRFNKT